jgi:hypothetical protein
MNIKNSVAVVRKQTIPTERPPLVGDVSAVLLRVEGIVWSAQRIPVAVNLDFLDRNERKYKRILIDRLRLIDFSSEEQAYGDIQLS